MQYICCIVSSFSCLIYNPDIPQRHTPLAKAPQVAVQVTMAQHQQKQLERVIPSDIWGLRGII